MRTNYYPLWEAERGKFRLNWKIKKIRPLKELIGRIGKSSPFTDEEMATLEKQVEERYDLIEGIAQIRPLELTH